MPSSFLSLVFSVHIASDKFEVERINRSQFYKSYIITLATHMCNQNANLNLIKLMQEKNLCKKKKTISAGMGLELVASGGKAAILTTIPLILSENECNTNFFLNIQKMYIKSCLLAGFVIFFLKSPIYSI